MVTVELVGGPGDGATFPLDILIDLVGDLPREIKARWVPLDEPEDLGRYVVTRKLARGSGRLIYQWSTLR
jgi:hypothetical protein